MSDEVEAAGEYTESAPFTLGGRRRRSRSRRARRGGGGGDGAPPPPLAGAGQDLKTAGEVVNEIKGGEMTGGRRSRSTAKKIANELKRVAKKAKKK